MFKEFVKKNNLPKYRLQQLYELYYKNPINSWDELTTWSLDLREKIKEEIPFSTLNNFKEYVSNDERTVKLLSFTKEGNPVETVLMKSKKRNTLCLSCMSGCPVGCTFCATGQMGFNKNLTDREIIDQVLYFKRKLHPMGQKITNIVFMGMGEPMLNLENVVKTIGAMTSEEKLALSHRRITLSTVGYIKELKEFLDMDLGVKVAISLHSANQELRESLMPTVATNNPLEELMGVLINYQKRTNKRITYEYLLLKDINDSIDDAKKLAKLLKNQICLVNLINFNPSEGIVFSPTEKQRIRDFQKVLDTRRIKNTLRYSYGKDIAAACGQLANTKL
jgi:23S rRNA (adenine2503-C2)-methyltransferase